MINVTQNCLRCGKPFEQKRSFAHDYRRQYCSKSCEHLTTWIKKKAIIKESGEFALDDRRAVRRYFREEFGWKCDICKLSEWNGKEIPLIADHIDGNYQNNKIENYRLVCPNCEAQLPTFKNRNKGSGRNYRRKNTDTAP